MKALLLDLAAYGQDSAAVGWAGLATIGFLASLLFIPRNLVSLVGGFLFGWVALPVVLVAGTCGAAIACVLTRRLLRPWVLRFAARRATCQALLRAVDEEGWRVVALLRLAGPLPCSGQSYLFGLTGIPIPTVALVSLVGAVPQSALFVYLGTLGHEVLREGSPGPLQAALLVLAALSVTGVATLVGRRTRRILAAAQPASAA